MSKQIFEEAIVHSNLCLKKWEVLGKKNFNAHQDRYDYDKTKSLILTWLNKAYIRSYSLSTDWRARKALSKDLFNSIHFTVSQVDPHFTSITVNVNGYGVNLPELDYEELNTKANGIIGTSGSVLTSVDDINFDDLKNIKFQ